MRLRDVRRAICSVTEKAPVGIFNAMPDEFPYDVFLSQSAKDKRSKPPTFPENQGGNGLERSRALVLGMSAKAFGSDSAQLERSAAIHRDTAIGTVNKRRA